MQSANGCKQQKKTRIRIAATAIAVILLCCAVFGCSNTDRMQQPTIDSGTTAQQTEEQTTTQQTTTSQQSQLSQQQSQLSQQQSQSTAHPEAGVSATAAAGTSAPSGTSPAGTAAVTGPGMVDPGGISGADSPTLNGTMGTTPETAPVSSKKENIYPIEINKKFGFIDKTGKMVIEPTYDACERIWDDYYSISRHKSGPIYYKVTVYSRNEFGIPDRDAPSNTKVLGPGTEVLFSQDNAAYYNFTVLENGSMIAFGQSGFVELFDRDQQMIISDQKKYFYLEPYLPLNRMVAANEDGHILLDLSGDKVSDTIFEWHYGLAGDRFLFGEQGGRVAVTDINGNIKRRFPDLLEIHPLGNGLFSYRSAEGSAEGYGLMDDQFDRITEPIFSGIYADSAGLNFIVDLLDREETFMAVIDRNGSHLINAKGIEYVSGESLQIEPPGEVRYLAYFDDTSRSVYDSEGQLIYKDAQSLEINGIYGEYIALSEKSNGPNQYLYGLKRISDNIDGDEWVLEPVHSDLYMLDGTKYLFFGQRSQGAFTLTDMGLIDLTTGKKLLDKHLTSIEYVDEGIFFARTNNAKGYMNEAGEWIFRATVYDTLEIED